MIHTLAILKNGKRVENTPLEDLHQGDFQWYWVDFSEPTREETELLSSFFHFHPLAIEDCIHDLQRPKLDYYDDFTYFVLHAINNANVKKEELDIFIGEHFMVTYHKVAIQEVEITWNRVAMSESPVDQFLVLYYIMDKFVDNYFPTIYKIEDDLNDIEENTKNKSMEMLMDELFDIRGHLLHLRHTVNPMRDLLYRMLNSHYLNGVKEWREYYADIYDHLLKLTEMIESNREIATDIRDSYMSLNTHQTNRIMQILTVITTIFMPLTFIAGVYGMNFDYMPELHWKYSYFVALSLMVIIAISMFLWFRRKGWFNT